MTREQREREEQRSSRRKAWPLKSAMIRMTDDGKGRAGVLG